MTAAVMPVFAEQTVTVLYTGFSFAAVYPHDSGNGDNSGGLARRAAIVARERAAGTPVVLLDAGNFFAGGTIDPDSKDPELDRLRTDLTARMLVRLGYDAVGLGQYDLSHGERRIAGLADFKVPLVGSNLLIPGVHPYRVIDAGGVAVGVVSLVSSDVAARAGVTAGDSRQALESAVKELTGKADVIVLLASVPFKEIESLCKACPDIDVVIMDRPGYPFFEHRRVGDTVVVTPFFQGKKLGKITVSLKDGTMEKYAFESIALDDAVTGDEAIAAELPVCFSYEDCPVREKHAVRCARPGTATAACDYRAIQEVPVSVITDTGCAACSTVLPREQLARVFPGVSFTDMDYRTEQARELIKRFSIKTLPAFIADGVIERQPGFSEIRRLFVQQGGAWLLRPDASGIFFFLDRDPVPGRIDYFMKLDDHDGLERLRSLSRIAADRDRLLVVHPVFTDDDAAAREEALRFLSIRRRYPEKAFDYLRKRQQQQMNTFWVQAMEELDIPVKEVTALALSNESAAMLRENTALTRELGIVAGSVVLVDNRNIFSITQGVGEQLEQYLNVGESE